MEEFKRMGAASSVWRSLSFVVMWALWSSMRWRVEMVRASGARDVAQPDMARGLAIWQEAQEFSVNLREVAHQLNLDSQVRRGCFPRVVSCINRQDATARRELMEAAPF
jgi:hypothetical protein